MNPASPNEQPQAPAPPQPQPLKSVLPDSSKPTPVSHSGHSMTPDQLSPIAHGLFDKIEFDANERLICEIRKHPFGLFVIYFTGFLIATIILVACIAASSLLDGDALGSGSDPSEYRSIIVLVGLFLSILAVIGSLIGGFIYRSNVVLVTNEKIAQVLYRNIIDRKISQLSIGDVQDVTVRQDGIFARIFKYGTLVVETAGEQQNYLFTYTPDPYQRSKDIVNAHEENLKQYGN